MKVYVLTLDSMDGITGRSTCEVFEGVYKNIKDVFNRINEIIDDNELHLICKRSENETIERLENDPGYQLYIAEAIHNTFYKVKFFVKYYEL